VFQLTSRAAAALAESRARKGLADSIAIRISASESGNRSSAGYQMRFASHPWPHDVVTDCNGTKVFLAAGLSERLVGTVLDAEETEQGPRSPGHGPAAGDRHHRRPGPAPRRIPRSRSRRVDRSLPARPAVGTGPGF